MHTYTYIHTYTNTHYIDYIYIHKSIAINPNYARLFYGMKNIIINSLLRNAIMHCTPLCYCE